MSESNVFKLSKFYAYYVITWVVLWIPLRFFSPIGLMVRHTYQLPSNACTNTLVSDLGGFSAIREALMVLFIIVPFSVCFMIWTKEKYGFWLHFAVLLTGLLWGIVIFGVDINDLIYANVGPADPSFNIQNLARDNKWCLYYAGQVGTELFCANTGPCTGLSVINPNSFAPNGRFLIRFVLNFLIFVLMAFDMWTIWEWKKILVDPPTPPPVPTNRQTYTILKEK